MGAGLGTLISEDILEAARGRAGSLRASLRWLGRGYFFSEDQIKSGPYLKLPHNYEAQGAYLS